ncbi:PREDICTED: interferon regulatory factor 8-like [Thamnophis sirtalis]|uniref:Interferon regulatory factor 8-like n=1 Tax=Thamnophis sirtalis TaxID=35019 RepID=A0A6I9XQQ5_9SAUR|nr:PREDICTED: interferon regulatory factor 8-like [Thamnophis sirtalis]
MYILLRRKINNNFFLFPIALSLVTGFAAYEPLLVYSQLVINFYYGGKLVGSTTTSRPEGCRISLGEAPYCLDSLEHVQFPSAELIPNERQRQITRKLFGHLERGVLLHCNKQGIFIKRLSQGRVFWSGNTMACKEKPNKLDRDEVVKIFDTNYFLRELHQYYNNQGRFPNSKVILCFGEEFPDAVPLRCKLILVEIEQLSIRQLVEEARKNETGPMGHPAGEEVHYDPMYRNFQDSCGPHQRPIFRENQQITV